MQPHEEADVALIKGPLGLSIPAQRYPSGPSFYNQPKKVEQWIAALPRAHLGETSRLLYSALKELNQNQLSPEVRLSILEALLEPTVYAVQSLTRHVIGQAFPLSPKRFKVCQLIKELASELAVGFKVVVETALGQGGCAPGARPVLFGMYRALEMNHLLLQATYLSYAPYPEETWRENHILYRYAYEHGTHAQPMPSGSSIGTHSTIEDIYKQILLMALVNPYQLSQDDIQRIGASLPFWASSCLLIPLGKSGEPPGLFAVDLERDEPPAYHAQLRGRIGPCVMLDTHLLAQQLRELLSAQTGSTSTMFPPEVCNLSQDTLRRMLLSWGLLSKRNFPRRGKSSQVQVTVGLTATYKLLHRRMPGTHRTQLDSGDSTRRATYSAQPIPAADGKDLYPESWDFTDTTAVASIYQRKPSGSPMTFILGGGASVNREQAPQVFNVTNESAGGYCLLWNQRGATAVNVGDLMCIHPKRDTVNTPNICVVRWMKSFADRMVLGVEILSPSAEPATARVLRAEGTQGEPLETLVLPPVAAVGRPSTLLTSSMCRSGDILVLESAAGSRLIQLTYLQQTTRSFREFQFINYHPEETRQTEEPVGFDAIWSSL